MPDDRFDRLLDGARAGDAQAFIALQAEIEPILRRQARRWVASEPEACDELVQDALVALHENLHRIESAAHLIPFVLRVLRNRAYDHLRRRARRDETSLDALIEGDAAALIARRHPSDEVVRRALLRHVLWALDGLPQPQRDALILYAFEDLSHEQIARATGVEVGTVKSRLHYGRRRLRRLLHPDLLDALDIPRPERTDPK